MDVKVTASEVTDGTVAFDLDGKKPRDFKIKLEEGSGAKSIDYKLKDHTNRGLEFDTNDPIWVGEDCPCPPPQGMNSDQLEVVDCRPDRLSVVDRNDGPPRELRYQLNFTAADGTRATCDPVIVNGGGGAC